MSVDHEASAVLASEVEFQTRFHRHGYSPFTKVFQQLLQESVDPDFAAEKSGPSFDCEELCRLRADTRARVTGQLTWPAMPAIVEQLDAVLDLPNSRAADIASVVMLDPGLTTQVLALVNSPAYSLSRKIESLQQAVALLGTDRIRSAALAVSVMSSFSKSASGFDVSTYWQHSLAVATGAQLIAGVFKDRGPSTLDASSLFLAGLLHDVGRLVIAQQLPDEFAAIQDAVNIHNAAWLEAESAILGMTHAEVGHDLLVGWSMAEEICEATRDHHRADTESEFARVVHCADAIAHGLGFSPEGQPFPHTAPQVWEALELSNNSVRAIATGLRENMDAIGDALLG